MKRIFLALFSIAISCSNNFENGESLLRQGKYVEAKEYYKLVKQDDVDYSQAQNRIVEIEELIQSQIREDAKTASKKLFDSAYKAFKYYDFSGAKTLFNQIDESDDFYRKSRYFIFKIDSINREMALHDERVRMKWAAKDEKALQKVKQKAKSLLYALLEFKDNNDFHSQGFIASGLYNKWLTEVQDLSKTTEAKLLLNLGFVAGDLEMLGYEYQNSKGEETDYSKWIKKTITDGLK